MESYIREQGLAVRGKAWQVRLLLKQWVKSAEAGVTLQDFLLRRTTCK